MKRAIVLAQKSPNPSPNPKVGAAIVKNGKIIATGFHESAGQPHAEIIALKKAGNRAKDATLFVTLEPCHHHGKTPPCTNAILKAGIKEVIIGMLDPNKLASGGAKFLRKNGVIVRTNILTQECRAINQIWLKNISQKIPYLALKLALDKNGNTIPPKSKKWITNAKSRQKVMHLRRRHDAILVGVNTVITDNPKLTIRNLESKKKAVRIILDPNGRTPRNAKVFQESGTTIVVSRKSLTNFKKTKNIVVQSYNLKTILKKLFQLGITSILIEGGAFTAKKLLEVNLVDRVEIFQSSSRKEIISRARSERALYFLDKKLKLKNLKIEKFDNDTLFAGELKKY